MEWNFGLLLRKPLTREQADAFDHCDALADGAISYTLAPEEPDAHPQPADPALLRELSCDIEAATLLDAIAEAVQRIQLVDLRAVGVTLPDLVTLDEVAQRSGHSAQAVADLSQYPRFPEPESDEGTLLYSWLRVAAFLRDIGDPVPDVPQEAVIADHALGLTDALDGAHVARGTLRALGLPTA
ncbi:hypothetical protein E0L36_21840 [Streptomyces sp. AJS327]|uniref:hypothetical protein n=1 Tax=Streptomyces sp. AJS327 TaxID=2545265 RepID=UPI0015DFE5CE|nr:hypothetical protein [Streptomyces sp. AJS327]MBA0053419.1 hypothetical protein [Streptomyces sp. AJS327]